jgi:hypothetical protein
MIRWLAMSIVTLAAVAVWSSFASPTPTTQPSAGAASGQLQSQFERQLRELEQQIHQLQQQFDQSMGWQLGRLRPLPEFRFEMRPTPWNLQPYGTPFRFNGLTVYIEPVADAAIAPIMPARK